MVGLERFSGNGSRLGSSFRPADFPVFDKRESVLSHHDSHAKEIEAWRDP
jgi:hypothetical protein